MKEKKFTGFLIINWRTGEMKLRSTKRSFNPILKPYEVAIRINAVVKIPEPSTPTLDIHTIEIPQAVVNRVTAEEEPV